MLLRYGDIFESHTKQDMGDAFVVLVAPRKPQLEAIAKAIEEARLVETWLAMKVWRVGFLKLKNNESFKHAILVGSIVTSNI